MRLEDPEAVYAALVALRIGEAVPDRLYFLDYEDGEIPTWVLVWRETLDDGGVAMIYEDQTPGAAGGVLRPRRGVLAFPAKTLATREYLSETLEWQCPRGKLCDLVQQARIENKRQANKEVA